MMTDTPESVTLVPIDRIEVLNSRDRNMKVFEEIVENIRTIGLKKPITVTEREASRSSLRICSPMSRESCAGSTRSVVWIVGVTLIETSK